ncbi:MAG: hypothetical protein JWM53_5401 [bacterium]|nr:hypothetical protein [bacterium]
MWRHSIARFAAAASLWGAIALGGCGGHGGSNGTPDGVLSVVVAPTVSAVSGLQLSSGRVQIDGLTVLGDVAPDGRSMVSEFNLDLLSTGATFTLSMLPQGVYSRVRFSVDHTVVAGTWRGTPLQVALESDDGAAVDLRSNGVEVTPGHDGELALGVDAGTWFAGNVLDGAPAVGGQIVVDGSHNPTVASQIISRLPGSFTLQDSTAPVR